MPFAGLPTQRDVTLTGANPLPSSLLNNLQDCVVGSKFPTMPFPVPALAFQPTVPANATNATNPGQWTANAACTLVAGVSDGRRIVVGTRIVSCKFGFNSLNNPATLKLRKRNVATGAAAVDLASLTINPGNIYTAAIQLDVATPGSLLPYTIGVDEEVWLEVQLNVLGAILGGAIITADR